MYRQKLYWLKSEETKNMEELINKMRTIAERLEAFGKPVSDEEMVMILLTSLPKDYNYRIMLPLCTQGRRQGKKKKETWMDKTSTLADSHGITHITYIILTYSQ